jgi:hypothetical protein
MRLVALRDIFLCVHDEVRRSAAMLGRSMLCERCDVGEKLTAITVRLFSSFLRNKLNCVYT